MVWASPEAGLETRALARASGSFGGRSPKNVGRGLRKVRQGRKAASKGGVAERVMAMATQCSVFLGTPRGHVNQVNPAEDE